MMQLVEGSGPERADGAPHRRHRALLAYSRDHHVVLQLARGLQRRCSPHLAAQLPRQPSARRAHVLRVFAEEIAPHFDDEETSLLRVAIGRDADLDAVIAEVVAEHALVHALVDALRADGLASREIETILDLLGRTLETHVRREERSLFARLQLVVPSWELDELAEHAARHVGAGK